MPPKTVIERSPASSPDVTVFKISGTLGFHEKETLEKLFGECRKRNIGRVVLDVERLTSLGGGCASIIRGEAAAGGLVIGVAAAKKTVLKFLIDKNTEVGVVVADTVDDAVAGVIGRDDDAPPAPLRESEKAQPAEPPKPPKIDPKETPAPVQAAPEPVREVPPAVETSEEHAPACEPVARRQPDPEPGPEPPDVDLESDADLISDDILDEILSRDGETASAPDETVVEPESIAPEKPAEWQKSEAPIVDEAPETPESTEEATKAEPPPAPEPASQPASAPDDASARELKKRIVQYNTLLSINNDFARIHDRKGLLEAFLLTTIAQVGVESAAFLQRSQGYFYPVAMKGIEAEEIRGLAIEEHLLRLDDWKQNREVFSLDDAPFDTAAKAPLISLGCNYIAPFIVHGNFRGAVLLGRPIRNDLDPSTIEFLKILVNQAAIAYESTSRFEEENDRTLGLVQTLIALIEENTLARGNTRMLSNYVVALARAVHYPDEHLRDLMYGTVLRDIGMIKVSDLIVRSPRELMPEEWDIIKRHPADGAEMMRRMSFAEHAVNIVLCHHERFNGEGYPRGLQGQQIPLGARIVSVVESYAAMLQERSTRPALTREEALNTLRENWGMRYDPDAVEHFIDIVEHEIRTGEPVADRKLELFTV